MILVVRRSDPFKTWYTINIGYHISSLFSSTIRIFHQFMKNNQNCFKKLFLSAASSRPFSRSCKFRLINDLSICRNLKFLSRASLSFYSGPHFFIQGLNVKSLRAFRVLRPLRLLSSIPSENPPSQMSTLE